jgi:hypothetical protein
MECPNASGEGRHFDRPSNKKDIGTNDERTGMQFDSSRRARLQQLNLHTERSVRSLGVGNFLIGNSWNSRVHQCGNDLSIRYDLVDEFDSFGIRPGLKFTIPVILPPGWLRLLTTPALTGSTPN